MTEASARAGRPPALAAAILVVVILLFGAATFVAGLAAGGGIGRVVATPSAEPTPTATPAPTPILETVTCTEPSEAFALLCDVYARIQADYVDELDPETLVEGAVDGMVDALPDPYSGYLPPEQYEQALDDLSGEFSGIGAEVGVENLVDPDATDSCTVITEVCALVIVAPLDGSPAQEAGLRAGDVVLAVDGEPTTGSTINELVFKVRGEAGTEVVLDVRRDERELEIRITRALIELNEVTTEMLTDAIGYIELTAFTDRAPGRFKTGLVDLIGQGADAFVVDLRNNPGGFLVAAQEIASEFVPAGTLLFTVESGDDVQRWEARPGGLLVSPEIEVVVLINGGSASASEVVAAALDELDRVTLVGEPTFGKNTVQVWNELPSGGGLRLTTDRWFTPEHNSVAPDGIAPDVVVASPEEPDGPDPQLDRAIELLGP